MKTKLITLQEFNLIRYGSHLRSNDQRPIVDLMTISKFYGVMYSRIITLQHQSDDQLNQRPQSFKKSKQKLRPCHIEFLICQNTLYNWAGLSLKERCIMFHRQYPDMRISVTHLRRIYINFKIKFKQLKIRKAVELVDPERLRCLKIEMKTKYVKELSQKSKIIFIDETVFSQATQLKKSWSSLETNIRFPDFRSRFQTQSLLMGISKDVGLEDYVVYQGAITRNQFLVFIQKLKDKYYDQRLVIFLDNLSVHKSKAAMQEYQRLGVEVIFSIPYSPEYNGIECTFFTIKQVYKKELLRLLLKGERPDVRQIVINAILSIDQETIKHQVGYGEQHILSIQV